MQYLATHHAMTTLFSRVESRARLINVLTFVILKIKKRHFWFQVNKGKNILIIIFLKHYINWLKKRNIPYPHTEQITTDKGPYHIVRIIFFFFFLVW